jgi:MFS family permease
LSSGSAPRATRSCRCGSSPRATWRARTWSRFSLYLRRILGYDPLQIGLAFLPVTVTMGTLSVRYTDRLVVRFGARAAMLSGLGLIAAGLALFALAPAGGGYLSHIFPVTLLVGTGAGLCFPALMALAMSSATPQDAGLASGLVNTTAQIGGALGLAVLATVSASRSNSLIAQHHPAAAALTDGYHLAFWIACGLVAAAAGLAAAVLRPQPSPSAAQPTPELVPAGQTG